MGNTEQCNNLSNVSFKILPLCKYTLVPATVKVLETFLETILWNHFQLFGRILNYFSNITKASSIQYWFQKREQIKISWSQVRRLWGSSSVVTFVFAKKSLTKTDRCAGALSWRRNKLTGFHFLRRFLLTAFRRRPKDYSAHLFIYSRKSYKLY